MSSEGTSSIPVADYRDFYKWKETERYREIVREMYKRDERRIYANRNKSKK